ncbi:MAG: hypothetical protein AB1400_08695 [Pseudomonadota bacterium]
MKFLFRSDRIRQTLCAVLLLLAARYAAAETVVIVNAHSRVDELTREQVVNIFMGRYRKLPDGTIAAPLDSSTDSPERRDFYQKLLNKSLAEINAYWARLTFSGRTQPPEVLDTPQAVAAEVGRSAHAVGYIDRRYLTHQVKVVYVLPE